MEKAKKLRGMLKEDHVEISAEPSRLSSLREGGFGEEKDGGLVLSLVEAAHLAWRGELEVEAKEGPDVGLLLAVMSRTKSEDFLRFLVYQDLRRTGRVVRYEPNTPFLRLYPEGGLVGKSASKVLVLPMSEDELVEQRRILESVLYAGRMRKSLLLAIVGSESGVTYYYAESMIPGKIREPAIPSLPKSEGVLIHDRVVVWDAEDGSRLYSSGFWGYPIGIRKPKPDEKYSAPLQLSLMETDYLIAKGVLKVKGADGKRISTPKFKTALRKLREKADARASVFKYWRDLGYVVKPSASKYGGHYLIYEEGPGIDHAPYLCIVSYPEDVVTPVDLIRVGRVATSVNKTLVVSVVSGKEVLNYQVTWERNP